MIFVGALTKLLGRGRASGAGAALAGFGLCCSGLMMLQQGMGGLAERLHPADLPAVLGSPWTSWWSGLARCWLALVVIGLVMTALMQSSTAAIAVTLSGDFAGAIGLTQCLRVDHRPEHRNGDEFRARRDRRERHREAGWPSPTFFSLIAALIALVAFPVVTLLLLRASDTIDGVTLLAGYHTAFNVVGVAVLLPLINSVYAAGRTDPA